MYVSLSLSVCTISLEPHCSISLSSFIVLFSICSSSLCWVSRVCLSLEVWELSDSGKPSPFSTTAWPDDNCCKWKGNVHITVATHSKTILMLDISIAYVHHAGKDSAVYVVPVWAHVISVIEHFLQLLTCYEQSKRVWMCTHVHTDSHTFQCCQGVHCIFSLIVQLSLPILSHYRLTG